MNDEGKKVAIISGPIIGAGRAVEMGHRGANKIPQTIMQYLLNNKKERGKYRNKSDRKRNRTARWS